MSLDEGKGSHITAACIFGGYQINGGDLKGLTNLQKLAINIIINERMLIAKQSKLIGALSL